MLSSTRSSDELSNTSQLVTTSATVHVNTPSAIAALYNHFKSTIMKTWRTLRNECSNCMIAGNSLWGLLYVKCSCCASVSRKKKRTSEFDKSESIVDSPLQRLLPNDHDIWLASISVCRCTVVG